MTTVTNKNGIEFDIDALATDVNGKSDRDLINVSSNVSVCIESWHDGTEWYRVYSDGWCEQGGRSSSLAQGGSQTITLLKPYINNNYTVVATTNRSSNAWSTASAYNLTTSQITLIHITNTGGAANLYWRACGYIR